MRLQDIQPLLKFISVPHRISFRLNDDELSIGDIVDSKPIIAVQRAGLWRLNLFKGSDFMGHLNFEDTYKDMADKSGKRIVVESA